MKYVQKEQELYIIMDTTVFQQLAIQTESEYPNENGGMLAGRYSDDRKTVYIKQLVTPTAKKTDCTSFVREATGMDAFWNDLAKEGLQYVGEWHSHPNGSTEYSQTDYEAMAEIEHEVKIANPILLIVSVKRDGVRSQTFYCYNNNQLLPFEKMIDLKELFEGLQKQMYASLEMNRKMISHPGSKGDATERHWIKFLQTYLPTRYKVDKAIVIDSKGNVSEQMDIVIYDSLYTPFIFNQDDFLYIPAESVYAVFEVKQDVSGNIEYAAQKVESVRKLQRTSIDMVASGRTQKARLLTKIIGGILTTTNSYKQQETIKSQLRDLKGYQTLDLGCCCDYGSFYVDYDEDKPEKLEFPGEIEANRACIEKIYNSRKVKEINFSDKNVSLFTFFLQLVSYLKSVGTVAAIDMNAYLGAIDEKVDEMI